MLDMSCVIRVYWNISKIIAKKKKNLRIMDTHENLVGVYYFFFFFLNFSVALW